MAKKAATVKVQKAAVQVLGAGVEASFEGDTLVLRIDTSKNFGKSASGKNTILGSTLGNKQIVLPNGKLAAVGVNVYSNQI
jgi:hypothetical protein